ncbi:uncharacterized protein RJT20DRAFT_96270, partial [Scheffersomyces xylosifermentans]|uniref:uncharacterized protein n=1 Tax=Scheffersomyces xylosifermentans TaxID=1304137 RepID=UPI00315C8A0E
MSRRFTHSQPTRSLFQPKLLVFCSVILLGFFLFGQQQENHQLDFEDALFLTKNSIKEFKEQYLPKGIHVKKDNQTANTSTTLFSLDLDYPLNSVVNSFFPIDSTIAFNTTAADGENITTSEITGRYASFSPILNYRLRSKYRIFPNDACDKIDSHDKQYHDYKDKILIVLRGECTFVDKVSNVLDSGLNPASVIIANDEPYRSLVTMFSPNFNQDGSLRIPIMFITNEDYRVLKEFSSEDITLEVTTASIGSWFSIIVSMILSPPLLIIFFYSIIICGQRVRRHQVNIRNARLVRELPVYIYNGNHLINAKFFNQYLKITGQTVKPIDTTTESNTHREQNSQSKDNDSPKQSPSSSYSSLNRIIVNGIDIRTSAASLHLLTAPENFYPAYKCSICLEKYTPLRSKVLVLDCKHIYHEKCLSNWLINFRRSCPLCNIMINPRNDSYLLAGQDTSSSDYGSMTEEDLEAQ